MEDEEIWRQSTERKSRRRGVAFKIRRCLELHGAKHVIKDVAEVAAQKPRGLAASQADLEARVFEIAVNIREGLFDHTGAVVWVYADCRDYARLTAASAQHIDENDLRTILNHSWMTTYAWQAWFAHRHIDLPSNWNVTTIISEPKQREIVSADIEPEQSPDASSSIAPKARRSKQPAKLNAVAEVIEQAPMGMDIKSLVDRAEKGGLKVSPRTIIRARAKIVGRSVPEVPKDAK